MRRSFRRRRAGQRRSLTGCLLWIVGLIIALVLLSLLFGGFQKGTKALGTISPVPSSTVLISTGPIFTGLISTGPISTGLISTVLMFTGPFPASAAG